MSQYQSFFTMRKSLSSYRRQTRVGGGGGGRGDRCRVCGQLPIFSGVLMNMSTTRLFPLVSSHPESQVWFGRSAARVDREMYVL